MVNFTFGRIDGISKKNLTVAEHVMRRAVNSRARELIPGVITYIPPNQRIY